MSRGLPMLTVRVPQETLDGLHRASAILGMSISDLVRDALETQLQALKDAHTA